MPIPPGRMPGLYGRQDACRHSEVHGEGERSSDATRLPRPTKRPVSPAPHASGPSAPSARGDRQSPLACAGQFPFHPGVPETDFDALIIGGGPGGSTAATFLARAGRRVLLLEKEHFPRFHLGESLLPYNVMIFEEMGILPTLEGAGLIRKHGAQFHLGNGSKSMKFKFRRGKFTRSPSAYQVERATFDHLLLRHARTSGADAREGWSVKSFSRNPGGVSLEADDEAGVTHRFNGKFLIDASGRGNLTGNQEKLKVDYPGHKKLAVFGHFTGVKLDEGDTRGDIHIVRLDNKWFWIIPITPEKTSVGCVVDKEEFLAHKLPPAEIFQSIVASSPVASARMSAANLVGSIMTTTDFSYYNRRLAGDRVLRVGDAAGFLDPIFSAGVYLAMNSGRLAARLVDESLTAGHDGSRLMKAYEKEVFRAMHQYWELVENYYTTPFMELLLAPSERWQLFSAVIALLGGELEGGWKLKWRLRLFFLLVKVQKYFPLAPRLKVS
jgi:FADH2-dependent halogenase